MVKINPQIFRANDIRGKVGADLGPEVVELLGKGFGTYLQKKGGDSVLIGRDNRVSSKGYEEGFIAGLLSTGCNVYEAGLATSPMIYFGLRNYKISSAVMVTGSHNPPTMNGFKLCYGDNSIAGLEILKIKKIIENNVFYTGKGEVFKKDVIKDYTSYFKKHFNFKKSFKVVVDGGNSVGGYLNAPIMTALGLNVLPLYCDLDSSFPNHFPDPTVVENNQDLIKWVVSKKYDLGIGYDGDGDRIGVVDNQGNIRWGDQLMILFSREILKKNPGAKILCEVKCSQALIEDVENHGGIPVMCATGHSIVEEKLKIENALLAGEMSGHLFFRDRYFGYDDALYAALRLLEIMEVNKTATLAELFADIPQYFASPEIRVSCEDEKKFAVVEKVKQSFKDEGYKMIEVDGARVLFPDGWGLLRASQTEGKLILRFEGKTQKTLDEIKKVFKIKLAKIGIKTDF